MQFSRNNLIMTDHVFLRLMQLKMFDFSFSFYIAFVTVSQVIIVTMLFLQFILYSSSFVGTLKTHITGAALNICQLKIKHNPFTLPCSMVSRSFLFIFYAGSCRLGSNTFRNSSYKEKTAGFKLSSDSLIKISCSDTD